MDPGRGDGMEGTERAGKRSCDQDVMCGRRKNLKDLKGVFNCSIKTETLKGKLSSGGFLLYKCLLPESLVKKVTGT